MRHTKLFITVTLLLSCLMSIAQVKKPDFAYPKTVAKEAATELKNAEKAGDIHAVLNALIRQTVAETLIDRDSLQSQIKTIEKVSQRYHSDKLYPVFLALLSDLYTNYYNSNRWVFDQRTVPLLPYPGDISEWSGQQFQAKIKELCLESVNKENLEKMGDTSLKPYTDIVSCDALTLVYFPLLSDFVQSNAVAKVYFDTDVQTAIIANAISNTQKASASEIQWVWRQYNTDGQSHGIAVYLEDEEEPNANAETPYAQYYNKIQGYLGNKYASILIATLGDKIPENGNTHIKEARLFETLSEDFFKKYPDAPFKTNITNTVAQLRLARLEVKAPDVTPQGQEVEVTITNTNAKQFMLKVFYSPTELSYRNIQKHIATDAPVQTFDFKTDSTGIFSEEVKQRVKFDKAGYYYILPAFGGGIKANSNLSVVSIRSLDIYPMAFNKETQAEVLTVTPATGAPIPQSDILLYENDKATIAAGKTNDMGLVDVSSKIKPNTSYTVGVKTDGKNCKFGNINFYSNTYHKQKILNAAILTNRSLYHPGDEIDLLVVAQEVLPNTDNTYSKNTFAGKRIRIDLKDANYQLVDTVRLTTDSYGRATHKFTLPTSGLTGSYTLIAKDIDSYDNIGRTSVMVSDYRMPDFEVEISEVAFDTPEKGNVEIKGKATSYSGMPMTGAEIDLNISKTSWGWWRWHNTEDKIYSTEATTDAEGKFCICVPDSVITDNSALYLASIDAVSASGTTATASKAFSKTKRYEISLNISDSTVDGQQPFSPDVKVYAPDGSTANVPLKWTLKKGKDTVAEGPFSGSIDLTGLSPATYTLNISTEEEGLANAARQTITIYNVSAGIVPNDDILFVAENSVKVGGDGKARILIGSGSDQAYIYYRLSTTASCGTLNMKKIAKGYDYLDVTLPANVEDGELTIFTVKGAQTYQKNVSISRDTEEGLKIVGESFRDNLIPTQSETWNIRVTRADGTPLQAALALDMYNKALEALRPHSFGISKIGMTNVRTPNSSHFYKNTDRAFISQYYKGKQSEWLALPEFEFYGFTPGDRNIYIRGTKFSRQAYANDLSDDMDMSTVSARDEAFVMAEPPMMKSAGNADGALAAAEIEEEPKYDAANGAGSSPTNQDFDYRDSDVPMAIWAPMLTTDAEGNVQYTFTVPNANTTWRLRAVAWSQSMEVGIMMRDFVASKPVMVQPNLPRFLRTGDTAIVQAIVMNNTDSVQNVTTTVELFDPMNSTLLKTKTFTQEIAAKQQQTVNLTIYVEEDTPAIGYRVRSSNGQFTDGEQNVIRILPSEASLIETTPFYLNPGDSTYTTTLPAHDDSRLTLTFCENPTWTIVTALPGLRTQISDYANSAAAALYSAAVARGIVNSNPEIASALSQWAANPSDSALVSMLQRNEDLKQAVLNSTPWVQAAQSDTERMANLAMIFDSKEVDKSIESAIKILTDLQKPDGGWAWGKWCEKSSLWVTGNVLDMLGDLSKSGWLPADARISKMVDKALDFYDKEVKDTDLAYTLVRPLFSQAISANGKNVIKATLADIKKHWKGYADPAYKAMAAEALYLNGDKKTALELMRSISEFGVYTKDQGLKFPSVNALYNYAIILDAYNMILPESKEVDGLRQQLIVRKQATDWGDAVVTTEVVRAIISSGSRWTVAARGADILAGDTKILPQGAIETATGWLRADISKFAGEPLSIHTSGTGPAYGAIYAQFSEQMDSVKASGCADLDIEKTLLVRRGSEWAAADTLKVGDRVKVQLTIHCKRNLQYVSITDDRPATFEPVLQLPGWEWSEGTAFYRENSDTHTSLHVEYMRPGTYLLTYEMNVGIAGRFTSGVATIQSQYAPEISAHSSGEIIRVK